MDIHFFLQKSVLYLIGLSLAIGLWNSRKYWKTNASLILLYLLILFVVEILGILYIKDNNQWLYNFSGIVELMVLSAMFYRGVQKQRSRWIILIVSMSCFLFLVIDALVLTGGYLKFWTHAFGMISLGISVMCFVYLLELATTERVVNKNRILLYWVVIGLLIYELVNLPVTVLIHNLNEIGNVDNILMIQSMAGIAMYFCFIIGFLWTRRQYNS